jgi:hypothetical protein
MYAKPLIAIPLSAVESIMRVKLDLTDDERITKGIRGVQVDDLDISHNE